MATGRQSKESALIATFERKIEKAGMRPRGLVLGVGDDAAVFRGGRDDFVVTNDVLVEGRHFERRWFTGAALGARAAAINLSDLAAMGALPRFALISLVVPEEVGLAYVRTIEGGVVAECARHGAAVVGGNVSATGGPLVVDVTVIGACARGRAWRRAARPGDAVVVAGKLGEAAAGLSILRRGGRSPGSLVRAYKRPQARLDVVGLLRGGTAVHAAIDVSDGLSTDLIHMCRAGAVGCVLEAARLPVSRALASYCRARRLDPMDPILSGGEDYALVMGIAHKRAEATCRRIRRDLGLVATVVGRFAGGAGRHRVVGVDGVERPLRPTGWDHLRPRDA